MSRIEYGSAKGYTVPDRQPDFKVQEWIFYVEEGIQIWTSPKSTLQGWKIISDGKQLFWVDTSGAAREYENGVGYHHDEVAEEYLIHLNEYLAEKVILGEI